MATPIFAWRLAAPKCRSYAVYLEQAQIRCLEKDSLVMGDARGVARCSKTHYSNWVAQRDRRGPGGGGRSIERPLRAVARQRVLIKSAAEASATTPQP